MYNVQNHFCCCESSIDITVIHTVSRNTFDTGTLTTPSYFLFFFQIKKGGTSREHEGHKAQEGRSCIFKSG